MKREEAVIMVSECEERITRLLQNLSDNNDKLSCKTETIAECENKIAKLIQTISDKNEIINDKTVRASNYIINFYYHNKNRRN